jgi:hypothetical protein
MNDAAPLEQSLGRIFDSAREGLREELSPDEYERRRHDFVFHLMDCKDDLKRLAQIFDHPEHMDEEAVSNFLIGFLYHVPPHLNAAGRLLLDEIKDPFSISSGASHDAS